MKDELQFRRLDPQPPEPGWIKNEAGQIIGYQNVKEVTYFELKMEYDCSEEAL